MKKWVCTGLLFSIMACGAYALTAPDSLITLDYLIQSFVPNAITQGEQAGNDMLQEKYDEAKKALDALQHDLTKQAVGSDELYSADLRAREYGEGSSLTLGTGASIMIYDGTVQVKHSGGIININTGEELASNSILKKNNRYLIAEETTAVATILSGAVQLGMQGGYSIVEGDSAATPFYDVARTDWYYAPVSYAYKKGLFSGMDEHHFAPAQSMNRAMLMTVLYKMAGAPADQLNAATITFDDVPENIWYAPFVKWGAEQNITAGTGPTTFSPEAQITREQVVALLYSFAVKYLGIPQDARADLSGYQDLDQASAWATDALSWAVETGILSSASADELILSPQKNASRAEVSAMLRVFAEKVL